MFERAGDARAFRAACSDARPLFLAAHVPVLAELGARALRMFSALLLVHKRGHAGVLLSHGDVAEALACSVSSARRAMVALLERGYAYVVAPAFVVHGAASSRRGNVYAVPEAVLASIERVRLLLKNEQASGTASEQEHKRSDSSHRPAGPCPVATVETANAPCVTTPCGQPEVDPESTVSAAPTKNLFRTVVAGAASLPSQPERPSETRRPVRRLLEPRDASDAVRMSEALDAIGDELTDAWAAFAAFEKKRGGGHAAS